MSGALRDRSKGWDDMDQNLSISGINGMERFRNYYQANRKRIVKQLEAKKDSSWFKFDLSKGGLTVGS